MELSMFENPNRLEVWSVLALSNLIGENRHRNDDGGSVCKMARETSMTKYDHSMQKRGESSLG